MRTLALLAGIILQAAGTPVPRNTPTCVSTAAGALVVTPSCLDPDYADVIIDYTANLTSPTDLHLVSGIFANTSTRFNIYLPPKSQFGGRFFQRPYPSNTPNATLDDLGFAAEAGAYVVQVAGKTGYRHEAASAKQARLIAAEYYGVDASTIYGYLFGGSGGSFQTIGAAESTEGVWQGYVPYVLAYPRSIPDENSAIALGGLVLQDATPSISDAILPGGTGHLYAALTPLQRAVLNETSQNAIPMAGWDALNYTQASQLLRGFWPVVQSFDASYSDDFWSKDGYLGTEKSELGDFFRSHRRVGSVAIGRVATNSSGYVTSMTLPALNCPKGLVEQTIVAGDTAIWTVVDNNGTVTANTTGVLDYGTRTFKLTDAIPARAITPGAKMHYDNSYYIAAHAYHRHQVPPVADGYTIYDQYRFPNGTARYPQRAVAIGPIMTSATTGGATYSGAIRAGAKLIFVSNLLDVNAYPWNVHWYRARMAASGINLDAQTRVYSQDHADHFEGPVAPWAARRVVRYDPYLWQALVDVANWVERGVAPPRSSQNIVSNGQVTVPGDAAARGGIQPVVSIVASASQVEMGQRVLFTVSATAVPGTGSVVRVEWDLEGTGVYAVANLSAAAETLSVSNQHAYSNKGTYFAGVRVATNRDGKLDEQYLLQYNLARVRVVVK